MIGGIIRESIDEVEIRTWIYQSNVVFVGQS